MAHGKCIQNFGRKPEGKKPSERSRRRWEDNIKISFRGNRMGKRGLDSSRSEEEPVAGCCEQCNELTGSIKGSLAEC